MPLINVKLAKPLPKKELKDKIAKELSEVLVRNLGKNPSKIAVLFEEIEAENLYMGVNLDEKGAQNE